MASVRDTVVAVVVLCVTIMGARGQSVVQGPVYYPTSGHRYYVVQAPNWAAAEAAAVAMGGHLATIEDGSENAWILANLSANGTRKLFIGLTDSAVEGAFVWASGSTSAYRNWVAGEPSSDDYVSMQSDGRWAARPASSTAYGVVEISGPVRVPRELSIEQALAAVSDGIGTTEVEVAAGDYPLASFAVGTMPAGRTGVLRGAGEGRTVLRADASNQDLVLILNGSWNVSGITFTGAQDHRNEFLGFNGGVSRLTGCAFEVENGQISAGLALALGTRVTMSGCRFVNLAIGVTIYRTGGECGADNCEFRSVATPVHSMLNTEFDAMNCTFSGATTVSGGVFRGTGLTTSLTNCVLDTVTDRLADGTLNARYTLAPMALAGDGNLQGSPTFVSATDLRLAPGSLGIDAGDTLTYLGRLTDLAGRVRVVDVASVANATGGIDMGCYESADAGGCSADFNRDGVKNSADFFDFLTAFFTCP